MAYAVWVDNVYCLSKSPEAYNVNMQLLEYILQKKWRLRLKATRKQVVGASDRGAAEWGDAEYRWAEPFVVLGPAS